MEKQINVLSLFDGMSCGHLALDKAGIKVNYYYASEIDKKAIEVSMNNYPKTKQLGSVVDLNTEELKRLDIDILIGGSPCQGFSMAGKKKGSSTKSGIDVVTLEQYLKLKEEGYEFEGQSYLFWEYIRVLKEVKPKYFFLENVKVINKWLPMFNEALGVEPIMIDSALVSAQRRKRYFWTNIEVDGQPIDKRLILSDILEDEEKVDSKWFLKNNNEDFMNKMYGNYSRWNKYKNPIDGKAGTLCASACKGLPRGVIITDIKEQEYIYNNDKTRITNDLYKSKNNKILYRRLTPTEYERLQTVPEGYTDCVSNSARFKMLGNGWTVDVISHVFKNIK